MLSWAVPKPKPDSNPLLVTGLREEVPAQKADPHPGGPPCLERVWPGGRAARFPGGCAETSEAQYYPCGQERSPGWRQMDTCGPPSAECRRFSNDGQGQPGPALTLLIFTMSSSFCRRASVASSWPPEHLVTVHHFWLLGS